MTELTQDQATALRVSRVFAAPRDLVFRAWTEPARLKQWWGVDAGFTTPIAEVDLRVGGRYRLGMKPPDKDEIYVIGGIFREVLPPEKLVYTWIWETPGEDASGAAPQEGGPMTDGKETLVTVEFHDRGNSTELVLTHECFPDQHARDEHSHGWNGVLTQLALLVEGR